MTKFFRKAKAQATADMIIAMVVFLLMVSVAFYYISYLSRPVQPFEATLEAQGSLIAEKLAKNISWTIYKSPVIVNSGNSTYAAFEKYFRPDSAVDTNSIAVLGANSAEIPSSFSENTLIWAANISSGKNTFFMVFSKNTSLAAKIYPTDLNASGLWINNSLMNVLFSNSGISGITFGGAQILGNGIILGTSGTPQISALAVRAKADYPEGVSLKIYSNASRIIINSNSTLNPILYLSPDFTNYYNGSAASFSGGGVQFNSVLNFTDIYSASRGVAVIGNSLNVSVSNTTYKEIHLYNVTGFEIYMHSGDYTNSLNERDIYLNPPSVLISVPQEIRGISLDNLAGLAALPYASLKSAFSASTNFNLYAEGTNISVGKPVPSDRNVKVVSYPATVIGRAGNATETYLSIATWLGSDYA